MRESEIQSKLIKWAEEYSAVYPELKLLNASLNGIQTAPKIKKMMYSQGMKKGYPDLFLPVARTIGEKVYHGLFIELKSEGGEPKKEQIWWNEQLNEQGYVAVFCYGIEEAKKIICDYLQRRLGEK